MNASNLRTLGEVIEGAQAQIKEEAEARLADLPDSGVLGKEDWKVGSPTDALLRTLDKQLYWELETVRGHIESYARILDEMDEHSEEENALVAVAGMMFLNDIIDLEGNGIAFAEISEETYGTD